MKNLPVDIIANVLRYTNINEIVKTSICLNRNLAQIDINTLVRDRKDPRIIFGNIFRDGIELLKMIHKSGCFLSGLRVIDYFRPMNMTEEEPWIFYCQYHPLSYLRMLRYLESIDVKWETSVSWDIFNRSALPVKNIAGHKMYKGKQYNIFVCWPMGGSIYHGRSSFVFGQLGKVCSPSYCMMLGNIAIAPYATDLFNDKAYIWTETARQMLSLASENLGVSTVLQNTDSISRYKEHMLTEYVSSGIKLIDKGLRTPAKMERIIFDEDVYISTLENYIGPIESTMAVEDLHTVYHILNPGISFSLTDFEVKDIPKDGFEETLYSVTDQFLIQNTTVNTITALLPYLVYLKPKYISTAIWQVTIMHIVKKTRLWVCI